MVQRASELIRRGEKPVLRPRQAEILAQRPAFVFGAEDAAPLQFRHHLRAEILEPAGQVDDVAAVAGRILALDDPRNDELSAKGSGRSGFLR